MNSVFMILFERFINYYMILLNEAILKINSNAEVKLIVSHSDII